MTTASPSAAPSAAPPARSATATRGWSGRAPNPMVVALVLVAAFLFLFPVVMFVVGAFRTAAPGLPGSWSVRGFVDAYTSPTMWPTLRNSVVLSTSVLIIATSAGLFFAWVVARTTTPLRRLVTPMMVLVFAIPPLFFALSWSMLANDPAGMINKAWMALGGGGAIINVQSWYGLIGTSAMKATAAAYLLLLGPVMAIDRALEEASLMSGAGRLRTLVRVSVPSLGPALTGPMILGFVVGIGMLDMPLVLGLPAGIRVFPTEIYNYIANSTPAKYAQANALGLLLIAIVVVLVLVQRRVLSGRSFATVVGKSYRADPADIGWRKYPCAAAILAFGALALILPLAQLVVGSLQPYFGVYGRWTLANYQTVWYDPASFSAFQRTIVVGVLSGLVASGFAFAAAYVARAHRTPLARAPMGFTWLLWGVPGVTLGLAMVWAYLSVPGLRSLYATVWIVAIALIVLVTPIAARLGEGSIAQLGAELEESARVAGAGSVRTFLDIVLRLVLPTFLLSWFVTGVLAAGNLDVPILMSSPNNRTVPLMIYELYSNSSLAEAAALFCILLGVIAAGGIIISIVSMAIRRKEVRTAWARSSSRA
ncbi:MAG: ABC transporter permease subunit [Streptosporangiales bacterium]|nr:ABC transporter permease subunit [Streptosporangiales bacterium]